MAADRRTAWFHAFSGIAGDMALGACLDAGADVDEVVALLRRLDVSGWSLRVEPVLRGGIAATHAVVDADPGADAGHGRTARDILALVEAAALPPRVADRAGRIFRRLAAVEGRLHRRDPGDVHLHEVGGLDAIVDVVGTCAALEVLGIDDVAAGPVALGVGTVRAAHGVLPVPAPAVVELLRGLPTSRVDVGMELTTPTGAAILATLAEAWGPMPSMVVEAAGYGAGTRDLAHRVNATQLVVGTVTVEQHPVDGDGQPMVELAVNVDDATGETLAHAVEELLAAGAADAWITPVLMKKGRPGHVVTVLATTDRAASLAEVLTAETGSFGVRTRAVDRWAAARGFDRVDVDGHPVRVKVSASRTKVEHDDAADVARRTGRPLREVVSLAEEAARRRLRDDQPDEPA